MPKLGTAEILYVPVEQDALWHRLRKHPTFLGHGEAPFHTYHCRDWPQSSAPKTVGVAIRTIPDLPTPMGQTDTADLDRRLRDLRRLTGLRDFGAADRQLTTRLTNLTVSFPEAAFDSLFNASEINEIRFRPIYDTYVIRTARPAHADLVTIAVPLGGYFIAYQRGFCLETPPKPFRGVLYARWAPTDKHGDWFAAFRDTWTFEMRMRLAPKVPVDVVVRRRRGILDRMQRRGIPTIYR